MLILDQFYRQNLKKNVNFLGVCVEVKVFHGDVEKVCFVFTKQCNKSVQEMFFFKLKETTMGLYDLWFLRC